MQLEHLPADVFGLSDIARAALADRPRPRRLPGMVVPGRAEDFPRPEDRLEPEERVELAETLERELTRRGSHVHVLESVRALAEPDTFVLLAGQQPGFLGGPLYDVYKALHVVRLARELESKLFVRVVPGFWNHADDHDVAEVHHLWIQNPNLDLRKVAVPGLSSGRVPLGSIVFREDVHRLAATGELVRQTLGDPDRAAIDAFLPRDGETFAGAFTRLFLELFGAQGLVVIEPDWIRAGLSRRLAHVVTCDVREHLEASSSLLLEDGLRPGIDPAEAALAFRLEDGGRRALRFAPDGFRFDGEAGSRTPSELAAEILQEPGLWSPAALLRPVVQDLALPVAGYVGGWGELAYHVQLAGLRRAAGAPATPFVPRLSATLVDGPVRVSLARLGLGVEEVLRGSVREEPAAEEAPPEVATRLRAIAESAAREVLAQKEELVRLDPGLASQLRRAADQIRAAADKVAQKAERVQANSLGGGRRHLRRVLNGLLPRGEPQERVRGTLEVVARRGTAWLDTLLEEIEPFPTEHLVVQLPEEGEEDASRGARRGNEGT